VELRENGKLMQKKIFELGENVNNQTEVQESNYSVS
jgi:hypothetical protein